MFKTMSMCRPIKKEKKMKKFVFALIENTNFSLEITI